VSEDQFRLPKFTAFFTTGSHSNPAAIMGLEDFCFLFRTNLPIQRRYIIYRPPISGRKCKTGDNAQWQRSSRPRAARLWRINPRFGRIYTERVWAKAVCHVAIEGVSPEQAVAAPERVTAWPFFP
jgi:hypothetical protein